MNRTLTVVPVGLMVAASAALAGCSSSNEEPTNTPSSTSTMSNSPAPVTTATPEEEASAQALALVPTYVATIDDLFLDPASALDNVYTVAVDPEASAEATAVQAFRQQGYRQLGRSQVVTTVVGAIDLTGDPNASPDPVLPSVQVTACVDVGAVQAVDAAGASVVAAGRPRYLVQDLTIVNIDYPDAASWRVREAPNRQADSCDG